MTTEAQNVKFRRQIKKYEDSRRTPDKVKMLPARNHPDQAPLQGCAAEHAPSTASSASAGYVSRNLASQRSHSWGQKA